MVVLITPERLLLLLKGDLELFFRRLQMQSFSLEVILFTIRQSEDYL